MKASAPVLAFLVAGCAVGTTTFYAPVEKKYLVEGTVCGWVPYAHAVVPLGDNISASLSMSPTDGDVGLSMQIPLLKGQSIQFENPNMEIELPSQSKNVEGRLDRFQVGIYGRNGKPGHHEYVPATEVIKGLGRNEDLATAGQPHLKSDLFISSARFKVQAQDQVVLHLPPIRVNGRRLHVDPIAFARAEKTAVHACVQ